MTIASTSNRNNYDGDAAETEFAITNEFKATADIQVWTFDTSTSIEAQLVAGFTVAGTPKADGTGFTSGTVTFTTAPSATTKISLFNVPAITQPQDFTTGGDFPEVDVEGAYDRIVLLAQQLDERIDRAVLSRVTSLLTGLELPDPVANQLLAWNSAADGLENVINAAASGTGGTTVAVSADDTTPATLLAKLTAGANITLTETTPGGNETVTIAAANAPAISNPLTVTETTAQAEIRGFRDETADGTSVPLADFQGHGQNQAATQVEFGRITIKRSTNGHTTGLEDGEIHMLVRRAGVLDVAPPRWRLKDGLTIDDPDEATGLVDQGAGTINCRNFFIENEPFESSAVTPQLTAITTNGNTARAVMTTARQYAGFGITSSDVMIVATGEDAGANALATCESYTISTNTWATLTSADNARRQVASAVHGGNLYIFGGANTAGTAQTTTQEYTPGTDTWDNTLTVLPAARRKCTAITDGDDIYIAGGITTSSARDSLYRYRPPGAAVSPDTMVTLTDLPGARADGCMGKLGDGRIYYFGGTSTTASSGATSTVFVYDISADEWETCGVALPRPLVAATCTVLSGYALIIGGEQPNRGRVTEAWLFDPYEQRFIQLGTLATARSAFVAGLNSDNDLIITGGFTTAVTDDTNRFGGSSSQLSQGVGFRNNVLPADGLLLNVSTGLAGRTITVRLGDSWRILPFSSTVTSQNVAFIGDSVLNGSLLVESSSGVFEFQFGATSTPGAQFDTNIGRFRTPGEVVETLA